MNIGFDAKRAFHNASGLGNYSRFVIKILQENFGENNYFLFNPKPSDSWIPPTGKNIQEVLPKSSNKFYASLWRSYQGQSKLENHELDVYHGLSNELPHGIDKNKLTKKVKTVVTIHDLIFLRYPELYKSLDLIIYRKKFKHAVDSADRVIAISETTKQDIIHFFGTDPSKIEVVYQGCDSLFYGNSSREEKDNTVQEFNLPQEYILNVGTIEKRKNTLYILKAMLEFEIETPIIIAGKPTAYKKELEKFIAANNFLKNKVHFIHNASNVQIKHLYENSSFSIYPSIFEGFGIPVLESIACGTPVITNSEGCFREAGGEAALYVNPNSISDLGNAIGTLLANSDVKTNLVSEMKNHLLKFEEKKLAQGLMNVYSKK